MVMWPEQPVRGAAASLRRVLARPRQVILFQPRDERPARYPEEARRLRLIARAPLQREQDPITLALVAAASAPDGCAGLRVVLVKLRRGRAGIRRRRAGIRRRRTGIRRRRRA